MLRHDVIAAVEAGQFRVHPITTIDEAIELLTGIAAGEREATGEFPRGTVNYRVEERLKQLAEVRREFDRSSRKKKTGRRKKTAVAPDSGGARA